MKRITRNSKETKTDLEALEKVFTCLSELPETDPIEKIVYNVNNIKIHTKIKPMDYMYHKSFQKLMELYINELQDNQAVLITIKRKKFFPFAIYALFSFLLFILVLLSRIYLEDILIYKQLLVAYISL